MTQNKSESEFDAVIFDCDGVLVDSEAMYHEVEIEVLAALGLAYDTHDFKARFMGMSDKAFYAALDEDARRRRCIVSSRWRAQAKRWMRCAG
jgi:beta-phosphoglucomutase-like phosphatase (HAD superfamily)